MASEPETTDNNAAGDASPHLDEKERDQASAHSSPQALVIHEIIREEGETALQRKPLALLWSALAAGLSMGFSFLTQAVLKSKASGGAEGAALIAPAGYCVGFIIVVLGRQQLFTESTLTVVLPVLTRKDLRTTVAALRLWVIVSLGSYWTTRVITLPGAPLIRRGPYRFLRHPNYVVVAGEIVGYAEVIQIGIWAGGSHIRGAPFNRVLCD